MQSKYWLITALCNIKKRTQYTCINRWHLNILLTFPTRFRNVAMLTFSRVCAYVWMYLLPVISALLCFLFFVCFLFFALFVFWKQYYNRNGSEILKHYDLSKILFFLYRIIMLDIRIMLHQENNAAKSNKCESRNITKLPDINIFQPYA